MFIILDVYYYCDNMYITRLDACDSAVARVANDSSQSPSFFPFFVSGHSADTIAPLFTNWTPRTD